MKDEHSEADEALLEIAVGMCERLGIAPPERIEMDANTLHIFPAALGVATLPHLDNDGTLHLHPALVEELGDEAVAQAILQTVLRRRGNVLVRWHPYMYIVLLIVPWVGAFMGFDYVEGISTSLPLPLLYLVPLLGYWVGALLFERVYRPHIEFVVDTMSRMGVWNEEDAREFAQGTKTGMRYLALCLWLLLFVHVGFRIGLFR